MSLLTRWRLLWDSRVLAAPRISPRDGSPAGHDPACREGVHLQPEIKIKTMMKVYLCPGGQLASEMRIAWSYTRIQTGQSACSELQRTCYWPRARVHMET
mmetsp:Transcript_107095/g.185318  ORF Transcript_107095/g.185318 Transcript_107095/m.185318 type:complete len:100 (-) Transcript_107095:6-305(-)